MECALLCRGEPQPAKLPAEPIALLDDMESGMPFSSAPAVQQPKANDSELDKSKKPKKEKHKKESKEKKHKKHKKEKKSKAGGPPLSAC